MIAVAKVKFGQIAMQVAFVAVLIDTTHALLEDAVVAFQRVRVVETTEIFEADARIALQFLPSTRRLVGEISSAVRPRKST